SATTRQAAAASFCWLALPAVTTPPSSALSLPSVSIGVGAVTLVMRENNRVALLLRNRHGHQLIVEEPVRPCGRGALVAANRIGVARLAADVIVLRKILGRLDHSGDHAEAFHRLRHHPP